MRPISEHEQRLLDLMLSLDFPGVQVLREQAAHLVGVEPSCTCGCPSIALHVDRSTPPSARGRMLPVELWEGEPGGRLVIGRRGDDGYLDDLECAWPTDEVRTEWPAPADCLVVLRDDDRCLALRLPDGPEVRADPAELWTEIRWAGGAPRVLTVTGRLLEVGSDGALTEVAG